MSHDRHGPPEAADGEDASARGIERCLHMLADEAAALRLRRTVAALRAAIAVCAAEGDPASLSMGAPDGVRLH